MYGRFEKNTLLRDWQESREVSEKEMPKGREAEIEFVKILTDNIQKLRVASEESQRKKELGRVDVEQEEKIRTVEKGMKVFVKQHEGGTKLKSNMFGPFEIIERTGAKTYVVKNDLEPAGRQIVHIDDIIVKKPILFSFDDGSTKLASELSVEELLHVLKDPKALNPAQHKEVLKCLASNWAQKSPGGKTETKGDLMKEGESSGSETFQKRIVDVPLKRPILKSCARMDFLNFRNEYEEYKKSGGRLPAEQCLNRSAQLEWALIEVDQSKRTDVIKSLAAEHAAKSFPILKNRIKELVPKGKMTIDSLRTYLGKVGDELSLLPKVLSRTRQKGVAAICVLECEDRDFKAGLLDAVRFSTEFSLRDLYERAKEFFEHAAIVESFGRERKKHHRGREGSSKRDSNHDTARYPRGRGRGRGRGFHRKPRAEVSDKEVRAVIIASKGEDVCLDGVIEDGSVRVPVKALVDTASQVNIVNPRLYEKLTNVVTKQLSKPIVIKRDSFDERHDKVMEVTFTTNDNNNTYPLETHFLAVVSDVVDTHDMVLGVDWTRATGVLNSRFFPRKDCDEDVDPFSKIDELGDIPSEISDIELMNEIEKVTVGRGRKSILPVLKEFKDIFSPVLPKEGSKLRKFRIDTTSDMIIHRKPRFLAPAKLQIVEDKVQNWLEAGIIKESTSPWAAPIVLAPRRDGDKRLCTDFTELNAITKPLPYPLPPVQHLLSSLKGYSIFATFDLRSGFHQVLLEDSAREKTAFITPTGHFEYTRLPFGLKNAPAHFQQEMSRLLSDLVPNVCLIYIDDVIVPANSVKELVEKLRKLFMRFRDIRLRLKAKKCNIGMETIEYLGMEVLKDTLRIAPSRVQGLRDLAIPKTRKGVKSIVGLFSYYRKYIDHFESRIDPLRKLLKGKFEWKELHQEVFDKIRQELLDRPPLHQIDYSKEIILRTDASDVGLGGILLQKAKDGTEQTIMFISKAFRGAETRWQTNEQECFAIKYCLEKCEHLLYGVKFVVETDHRNLLFMVKSKNQKVRRWNALMSQFEFTLRHVEGASNVVADGLSRTGFVRRVAIDVSELTSRVKGAQVHLTDEEKKDCYEDNGVFWTLKGDKMLIPRSDSKLKTWIVKEHHNARVGHGGRSATVDKILQSGISWAGLYTDVRKFVDACPVCIKLKAKPPKLSTPLSVHKSVPFHTVAVDTLGPFPPDSNGYCYVIVMVDCFTRWAELIPARSTGSQEAAMAIFNGWFARHGVPHTVVSDQGTQYCNYLSDHIYDTFGIEHHRIITGHHSGNGIVERLNKEVVKHNQALIIEFGHREKWSELLPLVQNICNNTKHSSLATTPQKLVYGDFKTKSIVQNWEASRIESEAEMPKEREEEKMYVESLTSNIDQLRRRSDIVQRRKLEAGDGTNIPEFTEGSYVLVRETQDRDKLTPQFSGPYKVMSKISEKEYRVVNIAAVGDGKSVHIDDMVDFVMDKDQDEKQVLNLAIRDLGYRLVDKITKHRRRGGQSEVFVKWYGLPEGRSTWQLAKPMRHLKLLKEYMAKHRLRKL
ncbi:Transposon Tf2-9 polyprotein [Aduncisulcus paluster]|uniref:RNA-directed DNA polymerase n=1 Tax=Aduncisulcus paluster TaxID=2918883 RepID=A0ABQ5K5H1_9EUKA|nr:Transposon Tf2-9 polyprotein [Aduncisulcus paluster]